MPSRPSPEDVDPEERESAYALLQRGNELLRDRHHAQAAIVLERAARIEPRKGSILEALARAYYNSGQHDRAADAFEALLEVDPSNHYGHMGMGLSLERLGRMREARTHLRLALAMSPANEQYRRALDRVGRKAAREEREAEQAAGEGDSEGGGAQEPPAGGAQEPPAGEAGSEG